MADNSNCLLLLLVSTLCQSFAHGQTTPFIPFYAPASLLPVAAILLAFAILTLCLIGFILSCLSCIVNVTDDDDENDAAVGGAHTHSNQKTLTKGCEKGDPPSQLTVEEKGEGVALKVKEDENSDVVINMEPHHCINGLKNTTRWLHWDITVGKELECSTSSSTAEPGRDMDEIVNRSIADKRDDSLLREGFRSSVDISINMPCRNLEMGSPPEEGCGHKDKGVDDDGEIHKKDADSLPGEGRSTTCTEIIEIASIDTSSIDTSDRNNERFRRSKVMNEEISETGMPDKGNNDSLPGNRAMSRETRPDRKDESADNQVRRMNWAPAKDDLRHNIIHDPEIIIRG
jgi:hypothetical protein